MRQTACARRFLAAMIGGGTWEGAPMPGMRRREFVSLLGGAAAAGRSRRGRSRRADAAHRHGLLRRSADDPEFQACLGAFLQGLGAIGLDRRPERAHRYPLGRRQCRRAFASICGGIGCARAGRHRGQWRRAVEPLLQVTRTVPIVFAVVGDPVGAGFVDSLARPGGNATGFIMFEYSMSGKWLELLKQIAPRCDARRGPSRSRPAPRTGQFGVNPGRGTAARRGGRARSTCATPARSSAPSLHSRAARMAV